MSTTATNRMETGQRWRIDPTRSSVEFHVPHLWGMQTVSGRFELYRGTLDLKSDPAIVMTIEAERVATGNAYRDKHLRSPDFFDVDNHPQIRFVSERATLDGERLSVDGRLAAAGRSIPVHVEGTFRRDGEELELDAAASADHRDLGMTWGPLGIVRTPSTLVVRGRLVRQA